MTYTVKHTPWTLRPYGDDDGLWTIEDTKGAIVFFGMEENVARLIAAAPELLEALKDARFALYGNGPGNPKIVAAIAKAETRP